MNTRTALRKSVLIAPAEAALRRAETQEELEDAWFDFADGFADESVEREHLYGVYLEQLKAVGHRAKAARYLRDILSAG